jgi:hypothetical protein
MAALLRTKKNMEGTYEYNAGSKRIWIIIFKESPLTEERLALT